MTRTKGNTIHALFRAIHAGRDAASLADTWRSSVMNGIFRENAPDDILLRLAPRFTLAGAALSAIGLTAGSLTIPQLAGYVGNAYASLFFDLGTRAWTLL